MENNKQNIQTQIDKIEELKNHLTTVQKALEDGNLQEAGDTIGSCVIITNRTAQNISAMFNHKG